MKELKNYYRTQEKGFTPWNKQISVIGAAMNPFLFRNGQGQIEDIEDNNNNIVALYWFGLQPLDFDLTSEKLSPLVAIANKESEKAVLEYFKWLGKKRILILKHERTTLV